MEIEKINAKLESFASMVWKDAARKAEELTNQAEAENLRLMEIKEISFLEEAYQKIQDALIDIEKKGNEIYSGKLFEAKQLLFRKRQDIIDSVFKRVEERVINYRKTPEYVEKIKCLITSGLEQVGDGEIYILMDESDMILADGLISNIQQDVIIRESQEPLDGGCIIENKSSGLLVDYSFRSKLTEQREAFLEYSRLNIDI